MNPSTASNDKALKRFVHHQACIFYCYQHRLCLEYRVLEIIGVTKNVHLDSHNR